MKEKIVKLGVVGLKRGAYVAWTLIGDKNVVIRAIADTDPNTLKACKEDYEKNGVAIFRTAKGAVIRILIGFGMYVGYDHNFALYGTKGTILTDKTKPLESAHSFAKLYDIPNTFENFLEIPVKLSKTDDVYGHGGVDAKMIRDFIKCIIEDTDPPIDVDMGIRISLPGIIASESAKRGGELLEIPKI